MRHIIQGVGVSHDGSPSPLYWMIWMVSEFLEFSNLSIQSFQGFLYCMIAVDLQ